MKKNFSLSDCCRAEWKSPSHLRIWFNDNQLVSENQVIEAMANLEREIRGPYTRIIETGRFVAFSHDARKAMIFDCDADKLLIAEAIVVNSVQQKTFAYLYSRLRKTHHPLRIFESVEAAEKWLETVRENQLHLAE